MVIFDSTPYISASTNYKFYHEEHEAHEELNDYFNLAVIN